MEGRLVSEAIQRIRAAEKKADESSRAAHTEAKRLIADACETSERMLDDMKRGVRAAEGEFFVEAKSAAGRDAEEIERESQTAVGEVKTSAGERIEAGVRQVLGSVSATAS